METETINLTTLICDSLNHIFFKIFSSIDSTIYSNLDNILFLHTDIIHDNKFEQLFGTNIANGFLLLANSFILGILIFYLLHYAISHLIYSKIDSPYQFIFKSIIFIACMNSSLWICEGMIEFVATISDFIRKTGSSISGSEINFSHFIHHINSTLYPSIQNFNIFSFDGLLKLCSSIGIVYILFTYSIRYVLLKILVLLSPFAFASLICNRLDGFFKSWLKQFLVLLCMQIFVAILLTLGFCLQFSNVDILSKLTYFATIAIIAKSNFHVKELFAYFYQYSHNQLKNII